MIIKNWLNDETKKNKINIGENSRRREETSVYNESWRCSLRIQTLNKHEETQENHKHGETSWQPKNHFRSPQHTLQNNTKTKWRIKAYKLGDEDKKNQIQHLKKWQNKQRNQAHKLGNDKEQKSSTSLTEE